MIKGGNMIKILDNLNAEGPYSNTDSLKEQSGVYVILGRNNDFESWNVLDVGESATMQSRVNYHDRQNQWSRCGYSNLAVAPIYLQDNEKLRRSVESMIRNKYNPRCGDR
jgi:hypothetical protein